MRSLKLFICLLPVLLLLSCSKEDEPLVMIKTISVTYDNEGAIVKGEILNLGKDPIVEYGFICNPAGKRVRFEWIVVGTTAKAGIFEGRLTPDLVGGTHGSVQAYLKTENTTIFGNRISLPVE